MIRRGKFFFFLLFPLTREALVSVDMAGTLLTDANGSHLGKAQLAQALLRPRTATSSSPWDVALLGAKRRVQTPSLHAGDFCLSK